MKKFDIVYSPKTKTEVVKIMAIKDNIAYLSDFSTSKVEDLMPVETHVNIEQFNHKYNFIIIDLNGNNISINNAFLSKNPEEKLYFLNFIQKPLAKLLILCDNKVMQEYNLDNVFYYEFSVLTKSNL